MIKLTEVIIHKYKSFQISQKVKIEDNVTVLVGMNEAGKTVLLEAMAKLNYFKPKDPKFKFETTQDYPRRELVKFQRSEAKEKIIQARFSISSDILNEIKKHLGEGVFVAQSYEYSRSYNDDMAYITGINANVEAYITSLVQRYQTELTIEVQEEMKKCKSISDLNALNFSENEGQNLRKEIKLFVEVKTWPDPLSAYIWNKYISPRQPKFWYFDEYYQLGGRINLNDYKSSKYSAEKNAMIEALLEIAGIDVDDLLAAPDFEDFTAQLEAASNEISEQLFKYWTGNKNLEIEFKIDKVTHQNARQVKVYHPSYPGNETYAHTETIQESFTDTVIDIRIKNTTHKITLPLDRRSKGFNWFFSFIVWFNKIKNDKDSNYILLFDEPGLNLHALAQSDLLRFLEDLSSDYQVIFSTHSPFMIDSENLPRIRTVLETENGSIVSDSIQEKDSKTLFPLQAALGYDIAQNLFISTKNLLVEGAADLLYLSVFSNILHNAKRQGLNDGITIVPVGGLDKVVSFISLMRGSKLQVACLLDTFTDSAGRQRLDDLIAHKIIKEKSIRFFSDYVNIGKTADIEDLFNKEDYLKLFNEAFAGDYPELSLSDLNGKISTIVIQINKKLSIDRFNHYKPAYILGQKTVDVSYFSAETLDNFEKMFTDVNRMFS